MRILAAILFLLMLAATPTGPGAAAEGDPPTPVSEEELEEFVPSEEVPADSAISFPVDI